jgi:hypothetical protein
MTDRTEILARALERELALGGAGKCVPWEALSSNHPARDMRACSLVACLGTSVHSVNRVRVVGPLLMRFVA